MRQLVSGLPNQPFPSAAGCSSSRRNRVVANMRQGLAGPTARQPHRLNNDAADFFVDHTCIDCDTCRWMLPSVYGRPDEAGQSVVYAQPAPHERLRAAEALLSCPTNSIHLRHPDRELIHQAQQSLPKPVPGVPGVWHCGWHDVKAIAAASYLIQRPQGNVMVDVPRYHPVLAQKLEQLGGVKWMFLTHQDDVGNHRAWAKHFGATRIIHELEVSGDTSDVEIQLKGEGPWQLDAKLRESTPQAVSANGNGQHSTAHAPSANGNGAAPAPSANGNGRHSAEADCHIIFTPGHTEGSLCLYHQPTRTIFTGDHLSAPSNQVAPHTLYVFEKYNWYSLPLQIQSIKKILDLPWLNVLPGHGRWAQFRDLEHRQQAADALLTKYEGPR